MFHPIIFKPQILLFQLIVLTGLFSGCSTVSTSKNNPVSGEFLCLNDSPEFLAKPSTDAVAMAYFSLGLNRELQKDYLGAIDAFQQAIRSDADNDALYMIASERLIQANRIEDAFTLLHQLVKKQPGNGTAHRWLAKLYLRQGDSGKAREEIMKAVNCLPRSEQIYLEALQLALKEQDIPLSLAILRKANLHAERPIKSTELLVRLLVSETKQSHDATSLVRAEEERNQILAKAIEDFPDIHTFSLIKAALSIEVDRWDDVFATYSELDTRNKGSEDIRQIILIHAIQTLDGGAPAVRRFGKELNHHLSSSLTYYLLGLYNELTREPEDAQLAYKKALDLDDTNLATLRKLALLSYQNGQIFKATTLLEQVLTLYPDDPEALLLAGQIALGAKDYPKARLYFERRIYRAKQGAEIQNPAELYAQLSMAYFAVEESNQLLGDALVNASEQPGSMEWAWQFQVRQIFLTRETNDDAAKHMETSLIELLEDLTDRLPENPEVEWLLGRTYSFQKNYRKAVQAYERYKELATNHPESEFWLNDEYFFDLAAAYERMGKIEESVQTFQDILSKSPNHHPSLNYVSYMWAERGENLDQAELYVKRALRLDPENGSYLDTLGWIYYQQGNFQAAHRELLRAAELEPEESVIAEHLGDVVMKLNRPWEARSYYRIALMLDPAERFEIVRESLDNADRKLSAQF